MAPLGNRRWQLLTDREASVFFGTLLRDPSTGEPIMVRADDLPPLWDEQLNAVFTFSEELCERLDEAAELQLRDDEDVANSEDEEGDGEGRPSSSSSSDDEPAPRQQRPNPETTQRDERQAQRSAALEQRYRTASALRQQALNEVLVQRPAARPDAAPRTRPRRPAGAGAWNRNAAYEERQAEAQRTEEQRRAERRQRDTVRQAPALEE